MFSYIGLDISINDCSDEVILYKMLYIVDKLHGCHGCHNNQGVTSYNCYCEV